MSIDTSPEARPEVEYPESDGLPMADNDLQYEWIVTIKGGLDGVFRDDPNVYVAGNMLWYPIEGNNKVRQAPDALVALGRPKAGHRGSYLQWVEGGIPPQVVFEVRSPGNRAAEMARKLRFYERFGVEEYYLYDPHHVELRGWLRNGDKLREIAEIAGWVSPLLRIQFDLGDDLIIRGPDGRPFAAYVELIRQCEALERETDEARQRLDEARQRADESDRRAERLAARLRELGLNPDE